MTGLLAAWFCAGLAFKSAGFSTGFSTGFSAGFTFKTTWFPTWFSAGLAVAFALWFAFPIAFIPIARLLALLALWPWRHRAVFEVTQSFGGWHFHTLLG
jgi:hypothetical protein